MRRFLGLVLVGATAMLACSGPEPVGISGISTAASADREVIVSPSAVTLSPGQTQQFAAQFFQNGRPKKALFTWTSSNDSVAAVTASGLVTARSAGEATITATTSRTSGTAQVTVRRPPPEVVATIPLCDGPFGSAVTTNGTGWIGQPSCGLVSRLNIATAGVTGSFSPGPWPVQIAANGDGSRIYVANFFGGQVSSIRTDSMTIVNTVFISGQDAYGITATPAGDTVFVGITNGPIYKIDMRSETILGVLDLPVAAGYHFEWNKTRTRLYASQRAFDGGRVFEIEPNGFTLLRTFETGGSAQAIQLSADDSRLFIAAQDGDVIVWDIASNTRAGTYTTGCAGYGMVRTPDNTRLWVGCIFAGTVVALHPETGALLATVSVGGQPRELSFDPGTNSLIVPNEFGWVDIIR